MTRRLLHAWFGVLATIVGVAAGHLVASLTEPAASPVLAVGSTVIDLTPTPLKEWAIAHFGTNDKTVLVGSVLVGVLLLAAVAGLLTLRRFAYGAGLLVVLVAVAGAAALSRPTAGFADLVPSIAAAVTGVAALAWLVRAAPDRTPDRTPAEDPGTGTGRRGLLVASGALAAAAVVMGGAGRWITSYRTRPENVDLPAAADPAPVFPAGLDDKVPGITAFRTRNGDFYRVDTRLTLPIVSLGGWSLTIDGDVDREVSFSFDDLLAMDLIERDITLTCVSNDIGGRYVGAARWLGVPLKDLLDRAGIGNTKADQILSTDVDGMTISTPLDLATDGRDAMIAVGMNGEALPQEHGFPARMVVPGLYGFVSATKWITRMTLTTYAEKDAYWTQRDWATDAPIKLSSRIDTPSRCPRSTPAAQSSAASPGRSTRGAWRRSRSASTVVAGRRHGSALRRARTTGASGTCRGAPRRASTRWPSAPSTAARRSRRPRGRRRSRTAPAASSRSSSRSPRHRYA
ncbi:molybdopterin-dependent oxidoreductase [Nocardioides ungokensis]|uniref:molybdopterin-dependent oxidoreductase n=1 Tax=Nocardioides ungokensis TaxID=1643322 RepID=UPI001FE9DF0C|nr:molybdopterin-dependent oxidoreductase [Nocardioides ungokensis]